MTDSQPCPECGGEMNVIPVVPVNDGIRKRKCFECGHEEKVR